MDEKDYRRIFEHMGFENIEIDDDEDYDDEDIEFDDDED